MFFLSNRTCRTGLSRFGKLTFPKSADSQFLKSAETKLLLTLITFNITFLNYCNKEYCGQLIKYSLCTFNLFLEHSCS